MKMKIDSDGVLWIERAGKMKRQRCPHTFPECGDHCPLFGDVEGSTLKICDIRTLFGQIIDERPKH